MTMTTENNEQYLWNAIRRHDPKSGPMIAKDGEGAWFVASDGKAYLDGVSGLWCLNVGHGNE